MARRVTRKIAELETTALVVPPPAIGDNNPPVETPVEPSTDNVNTDFILHYAEAAFADQEEGKRKTGSSVQRLAHAIFAQHAAWTASGTKVVALTQCAEIRAIPSLGIEQSSKSDSSFNSLIAALRKRFVTLSLENLADKEYSDMKAKITARNALIGRALTLAGKLALCHYTGDSFDPETGTFAVHKNLILKHDHTWTGFMQDDQAKLVTTIPLDGSSYVTNVKVPNTTGTRPGRAMASYEGFKTATDIPPVVIATDDAGKTTEVSADGREPSAGQGAIDAGVNYSKVDYEKLDLELMIKNLYQRLVVTEPDHADPSASGGLSQEAWTNLTDLLLWAENEQKRPGFRKDALDVEQAKRTGRSKAA